MVAIGNFDGLHRGHQHVLRSLKERARQAGVPAVMLTFEPHPRDVFAPAPFMFRLTPGESKARIAEALGLDGIVVMPFNKRLSARSRPRISSRASSSGRWASGVSVGADFHFGYQRKGTPDFLKAAGAASGFDVEILDLLDESDDHVSSSRIRAALTAGDVVGANQLLGYHWFFCGQGGGGRPARPDARLSNRQHPHPDRVRAGTGRLCGAGTSGGSPARRRRRLRQADVQQRTAALRDLAVRFRRRHLRPSTSTWR